MKKTILVTGGGTAIAWHLCKVCNDFFSNDVNLIVTDINDEMFVPSTVYANKYIKTPFAVDKEYPDFIKKVIVDNKVDIVIPIIPKEAEILSSDSEFLTSNGIVSSAPKIDVFNTLSNKDLMYAALKKIGIATPRIFTVSDIDNYEKYFVKPINGFGSQGTGCYLGVDLKNNTVDLNNKIIQEYCHDENYKEATVEVFNDKQQLFVFARERVATKAGVCTKAIPLDSSVFYPIIEKLVLSYDLPYAFNAQFMYYKNTWNLFDCNLRLGAGTAMATAAGFQLTRALIAKLLGFEINDNWFKVDNDIKSILRVYDEVVIT